MSGGGLDTDGCGESLGPEKRRVHSQFNTLP